LIARGSASARNSAGAFPTDRLCGVISLILAR
jgi:hypothetical protein